MAETNSRYAPIVENARRVLEGNRLSGRSDWDGKKYDYVCPSADVYPFQWQWDSAFHAVCLLHVDAKLAKQEIRCLLQGAQPDGFLPHMLLWDTTGHEEQLAQYDIVRVDPHFTATTQPPVLARAVERIYQGTKDKDFVREVLPPILACFDWLAEHRDPDGDGLVAILQPDESGMDASPKFDLPLGMSGRASLVGPELRQAMQRLFDAYEPERTNQEAMLRQDVFQVEEVLFNTIYGDGLRCLSRLVREVQEDTARAAELERRAVKVTTALMLKCWDQEAGLFWDLWTQDERQVRILTVASIFPLILEDLEPGVVRRLLKEHLLDPAEFWTRYPVPSVAVDEPNFDPSFRSQAVWRGPTWFNVNWYIYWGLVHHGYQDIASELANRTFELALRGGQREFYNPLTGEGLGANDFSWSSLVLDMLWGEGQL
ncbi:MAG: amylo-alpha-1,6-glucosidase [Chloroflexota bacterium]